MAAYLYLKHMQISDLCFFLCAITTSANTYCCVLTECDLDFLFFSKDKVVYTYRLLKTHNGEYVLMVNTHDNHDPFQKC